MDIITAIATLEQLQLTLGTGTDQARAVQTAIEALWGQLKVKRQREDRELNRAMRFCVED